jgi:uncharacterized protein YodC (DUF2158 family)
MRNERKWKNCETLSRFLESTIQELFNNKIHRRIMSNSNTLAEIPSHFEVGDVIALKSGGPRMTIKRIHEREDAAQGGYYCAWFVDGKLHNGFFPSETVVRALDENQRVQTKK